MSLYLGTAPWKSDRAAPILFTLGTGQKATKTIFSREFLQYATITKFRVCLSRIFENETCKLTDEHHSLTQQIVPGVDGITTSAYGNVVTEAEVEQSSACHVRDVCAAEQNTLMIATATTLQCSSCSYVTFRHTCTLSESAFNRRSTRFASPRHGNTSVAKFVRVTVFMIGTTMATRNALGMVLSLFPCHVRVL